MKFPTYQPPPIVDVAIPANLVVALAPQSDTGILGDNRTTQSSITANLTRIDSNAIAWLDQDGNRAFDMGVDRPVVSGSINLNLVPGENAFRFYQQVGTTVSDPTYLFVHHEQDIAATQQQQQANETLLAKAAIAYLGRPLTTEEHDRWLLLLEKSSGDSRDLLTQLSRNPEFFAVYAANSLSTSLDRAYQTLFGRAVTATETTNWLNWVKKGGNVLDIPWLIASQAAGSDAATLSARVLFAQQATQSYAANLVAAGTSVRTFLEIERAAIHKILSLDGIESIYEAMVGDAKSVGSNLALLAGPQGEMAASSDTGIQGDATTSNASVSINIAGVKPGALAWLDLDRNGEFNPGVDYPVINGSVAANLANGPNTLIFYQQLGEQISSPSYLNLLRYDPSLPTTAPSAPVMDLATVDDDGSNSSDNITSKSLVQINLSGLDARSELVWIDKDGNGAYDHGIDLSLPTGATVAQAWVPLEEGINGLAAYQMRGGIKSLAGNLTVIMLKNTDIVTVVKGSYAGNTLSLEFDRPIDWSRLDANKDGFLKTDAPGASIAPELGVSWGVEVGSGEKDEDGQYVRPLISLDDPANWKVPVPAYGSRFLTIGNVTITGDNGTLGILLTGIPDVSNGVTSNVYYAFSSE